MNMKKWVIVFLLSGILFFTMPADNALQAQEQAQGPAQSKLQAKELKTGNITVDFKDADIHDVLKIISYKSGINIVAGRDVQATVTIRLVDVPWEKAVDVVLKAYDFAYEWDKNIIMVTTLERLVEKREKEAQAAQQEPLGTLTYKLKFLDANDVKKALEGQLSPRGKIGILEVEPQRGWKSRGGFGGEFEKVERITGGRPRSKTLIITDVQSNLRTILEVIEKMDTMPQQVLIEARLMEVNRDRLKDLGLDWGTGTSVNDKTASITTLPINKRGGRTVDELGGINLSSRETPSVFSSKTGTSLSGIWPFDTGLSLIYQRLTGSQFQILLHALEEDVHTNTLSAPRIITLDGQEAYIMVGEKRPIVESEIESSETSVGISKKLKEYQPLGIELNVVPHICGDNQINMTIYPSVTSSSSNVDATSQIGTATSTDSYPIILVREAQTQVLINDRETIVIGGLLKDVKSKGVYKTPILGDIPLVGLLFQRRTTDTEKIDLLIFITAHIVREGDFSPEEISRLEKRLSTIKPKKN